MLRSRLKTYQRIRWPACATIVGELPMKERPLKQYDGRLSPPRSRTLCWLGPLLIQVTCPPMPIVTLAGAKKKSPIVTVTLAGPPGCTVTVPLMVGPWMPHMQLYVAARVKTGEAYV